MQSSSAYQFDPQPQRSRTGWVNAIPGWIVEDPAWGRLSPAARQLLQTIANACDPPDASGDLVGAAGGDELCRRSGISKRTFWRHVQRLEDMGFVVPIAIGGGAWGRKAANLYGVPGERGSMERRRAHREVRQMLPHEDGVYRPQVVKPGETGALFAMADNSQAVDKPPECNMPQTNKRDKMARFEGAKKRDKRVKLAHHHNGMDGMVKTHGDGVSRASNRGGKLPHVRPEHLTDTVKLLELLQEAVKRGVLGDSESERLRFVAAAERSLAYGENPCAMFAGIVNRGHWLLISLQDEDRARERLRAFEGLSRPPERRAVRPTLSRDARAVRAIADSIGGDEADPFSAFMRLAPSPPDGVEPWTRERWDRATAELCAWAAWEDVHG